MEIDVLRSDFKRSVLACMGVSPLKGINPALSSILIEKAGDNAISLKATDTETGIIINVPAGVKGEGQILINAKNLANVVKLLPEENVKLSFKDDKNARLTSGKSAFRFKCLPPVDFPKFLSVDKTKSIKVSSQALRDAILKTSFAMPTDSVRYNVTGANLVVDEDCISITSTDNYRLVHCCFDLDTSPPENIDIVLPKKAFTEIGKMLESENGDILLAYSQSKLFAMSESKTLICQSLDCEFPNIVDAIPKDLPNILQVNRKTLISSIKRVGVFSEDNALTFDIKEKSLNIKSNRSAHGDGSDEIEAEYIGEPMIVGFDSKYVLEVLYAMCEEKVRIDITSSLKPVLFRRCEDSTYSCVVMPMRVPE